MFIAGFERQFSAPRTMKTVRYQRLVPLSDMATQRHLEEDYHKACKPLLLFVELTSQNIKLGA